jgi:serine/threonine protein kinase
MKAQLGVRAGVAHDPRWAQLAEHVEGCAICCRRLERLCAASDETKLPGMQDATRKFLSRIAASPPPRPPAKTLLETVPAIEGYQILAELGRGGMGVVYKARQAKLDRTVAIKVPRLDGDSTTRQRFLREARLAAQISNPNLCAIFDVGEANGTPYFTMPFIEGQPLSKLVDKPWSQSRAVILVCKIAQAVQELHDRNIIHRDLKPGNIMVRAGDEPIVMDFGLAKSLRAGTTQLTLDDSSFGTPAYMPIEQIASEVGPVGPATDVYALGGILYELLTGQRPRKGSPRDVMAQIMEGKLTPPSRWRSDTDPGLEAICLKAMAQRPTDRFASMQAFALALRDWLKNRSTQRSAPAMEAISRRPVKAWHVDDAEFEQGGRSGQRQRKVLLLALIGGGALILLLALLGGGIAAYLAISGGKQRDSSRDGSAARGSSADLEALHAELKYIPDNCNSVRSLRVNKIRSTPLWKDVERDLTAAQKKDMAEVADVVALNIDDIDRDTHATAMEGSVRIITAKVAINATAITQKRFGYKETRVGSYTMYDPGAFGTAFAVPESTIYIEGPTKLVETILRRDKRPPLSDGLTKAMDLVSFWKCEASATAGGGPFANKDIEATADEMDIALDFTSSKQISLCKDSAAAEQQNKKNEESVKFLNMAGLGVSPDVQCYSSGSQAILAVKYSTADMKKLLRGSSGWLK